MVVGALVGLLALALCLQARVARKRPFDAAEIRRIKDCSDRIRRELFLPYD